MVWAGIGQSIKDRYQIHQDKHQPNPRLNLSRCGLNNRNFTQGIRLLPEMSHIHLLDLSENRFDTLNINVFSRNLKLLPNLKELKLKNCQLPKEAMTFIVASVKNHPTLYHINLASNYFAKGSIDPLIAYLNDIQAIRQKPIQHWDLSKNSLSKVDGVKLVHALEPLYVALAPLYALEPYNLGILLPGREIICGVIEGDQYGFHLAAGEKQSLLYTVVNFNNNIQECRSITRQELKAQLTSEECDVLHQALSNNDLEQLKLIFPKILKTLVKQKGFIENVSLNFILKDNQIPEAIIGRIRFLNKKLDPSIFKEEEYALKVKIQDRLLLWQLVCHHWHAYAETLGNSSAYYENVIEALRKKYEEISKYFIDILKLERLNNKAYLHDFYDRFYRCLLNKVVKRLEIVGSGTSNSLRPASPEHMVGSLAGTAVAAMPVPGASAVGGIIKFTADIAESTRQFNSAKELAELLPEEWKLIMQQLALQVTLSYQIILEKLYIYQPPSARTLDIVLASFWEAIEHVDQQKFATEGAELMISVRKQMQLKADGWLNKPSSKLSRQLIDFMAAKLVNAILCGQLSLSPSKDRYILLVRDLMHLIVNKTDTFFDKLPQWLQEQLEKEKILFEQTEKEWLASGVCAHSAMVDEEGNYYAIPEYTEVELYGYRYGSKAEAERLDLKRVLLDFNSQQTIVRFPGIKERFITFLRELFPLLLLEDANRMFELFITPGAWLDNSRIPEALRVKLNKLFEIVLAKHQPQASDINHILKPMNAESSDSENKLAEQIISNFVCYSSPISQHRPGFNLGSPRNGLPQETDAEKISGAKNPTCHYNLLTQRL